MIRAVLFDIDGTLIRTGGAGVKAFEQAFVIGFGIDKATQGMSFAGRTDRSLVREAFSRHEIVATESNFVRFFDTYYFLLQQRLEDCAGAPCQGVLDFIQDLRTLGRPPLLGLLTGNVRLGAELKLRHYRLWDFFCFGAFGDDHEERNCLAQVAKARAEGRLDQTLSGGEILVIGDTPLDVECGRAIGARVLAVGTGGYSRDQLRLCQPTWAVENLLGLRAAEICNGDFAPL